MLGEVVKKREYQMRDILVKAVGGCMTKNRKRSGRSESYNLNIGSDQR